MQWLRTFLRPTKTKVWLAIFMMIVNIALGYYSARAVLCTEFCPEPNTLQKLTAFNMYPSLGVLGLTNEFFENVIFLPEPVGGMLAILITALVVGLFWYLLSCVVIGLKNLTIRKA